MLSSMHVGTKISYGLKKKPEIMEFYNWSMAEVDVIDKMLGKYITKR